MDRRVLLPTRTQAATMVEPGDGPLDDPTHLSQPAAVTRLAAGDHRLDPTRDQLMPMRIGVIAAVGQQVLRLAFGRADLATDRPDRIDHRNQLLAVILVGLGDLGDQRGAGASVDQQVVLRPGFRPVHRAGAGVGAPKKARRYDASLIAATRSSSPALRRPSSSTSCMRFQTPAQCQSRNRRQQVMPQPQPISCGRSSQAMPVLSTNRMPHRQLRSGTGGRPPLGCGRGGGKSGSIVAHSSSVTSGLAIASSLTVAKPDLLPSAGRREREFC